MYEIAVHAFPFMLIYYHDKYKIQMCEKVVDDCLWRLKCAPDLFVTPKMLKNIDRTTFFNIVPDIDDLDLMMLTLIMMTLMKLNIRSLIMMTFWSLFLVAISISNSKHIKKIDKKLMSIAWHPTIVRNWCISKDKKMSQNSEISSIKIV